MLKRSFDVMVILIFSPVILPIIAIIALLVKILSPGPLFYRQIRIGKNQREFQFIKFRSMIVDADCKGMLVTSKVDDRITAIGRLLRRTKLDELPTLWNVIKGEISLVGPRPEVPKYVQHYKPEWERVFTVRPGVTDLATIQFRDEESVLQHAKDTEKAYINVVLPLKINLAMNYVNKITFWFDLKILFLTIWGITLGRFFAKPNDTIAKEAIMQIKSLNL